MMLLCLGDGGNDPPGVSFTLAKDSPSNDPNLTVRRLHCLPDSVQYGLVHLYVHSDVFERYVVEQDR